MPKLNPERAGLQPMGKYGSINVRLIRPVYDQLAIHAWRTHRSVGNFVNHICRMWLDRQNEKDRQEILKEGKGESEIEKAEVSCLPIPDSIRGIIPGG